MNPRSTNGETEAGGGVTELEHFLLSLREGARLEGGEFFSRALRKALSTKVGGVDELLPPGALQSHFPAGLDSRRRGRGQPGWELGARGWVQGACARA